MVPLLLVSARMGGGAFSEQSHVPAVLMRSLCSYLTYIKLSTAIKRNESMAKSLQKALLQQQRSEEDGKRTPRPQDLIRLYDIILQVGAEQAASTLSSLHFVLPPIYPPMQFSCSFSDCFVQLP